MSSLRLVLTLTGIVTATILFTSALCDSPFAAAQQPEPKPKVDRYGDPLPPDAVSRLGTVRYRCEGSVIGFLPDSKTLVSAPRVRNADRQKLQFLNAESGKLVREFELESRSNAAVTMSPNGKLVALAAILANKDGAPKDAAIQVWDIASGKKIQSFNRDYQDLSYSSLAFSSDGKLLASFAFDGFVRVQSVGTGAELQQHAFPKDNGPSIALSPNGATLAVSTGPNTRKLFLWNWQAGEEPRELKVPDRVGSSLSFSPDSKVLLECGYAEHHLRAWEVATGKLLHSQLPSQKGKWFYHATFTPDGKTVVAAIRDNWQGSVDFWDSSTWQHKGRIDTFELTQVFVSPNNKLLASTGRSVRVWDFATKKELSANDETHHNDVSLLGAFGDFAVTSGDDGSIRVWDIATAKQRMKISQVEWVRGMAISPDGTKIVSSSLDNTVCLWETATGKQLYKLPGHGRLGGKRTVRFTPDGKHFLSWGDDMYLRKWEVATGKAVLEIKISPDGKKEVDDPSDNPRDDLLSKISLGHGTFSPDGKYLALEYRPNYCFFEVETGRLHHRLPMAGVMSGATVISHDSRLLLVNAQASSTTIMLPDGSKKTTEATEHPVQLWELSSHSRRLKLAIPGRLPGPLAFSQDGKMFAAGTRETPASIHVWDAIDGRELPPINGFSGVPRSLAFSSDGNRLISGMDDLTARDWDLSTYRRPADKK